MKKSFPLFQSHLDLAHTYWKRILNPGDCAIDATCGNGYDTLFIAQSVLRDDIGKVIAIDKQSQAIESARLLLSTNLEKHLIDQIDFVHGCHESFPDTIIQGSVKLIVYNLGYLPGSDKSIKTLTTTIQSLKNALPLLCSGGMISITCYPGHAEGKIEEMDILAYAKTLPPQEWNCCYHQWINRSNSPSLLLIQKALL